MSKAKPIAAMMTMSHAVRVIGAGGSGAAGAVGAVDTSGSGRQGRSAAGPGMVNARSLPAATGRLRVSRSFRARLPAAAGRRPGVGFGEQANPPAFFQLGHRVAAVVALQGR